MWVRGPLWDSCWLLSGLPLGCVLTLAMLWLPAAALVFWIILMFQTGHCIAPMTAAWGHPRFRMMMLRRSCRFVVLPLLILVAGALAGYLGGQWLHHGVRFNPDSFTIAEGPQSLSDLRNPFLAMVLLYALWNGWHFGRQNFGVMSLYRRKSGVGVRRADLVFSCCTTWLMMIMPFVAPLIHEFYSLSGCSPAVAYRMVELPSGYLRREPYAAALGYIEPTYLTIAVLAVVVMLAIELRRGFCLPRLVLILTQGLGMALIWVWGLWGLAIIAINHWLTSIGLASNTISPRHCNQAALAIMLMGVALFVALFLDPHKVLTGSLSAAALSFSFATVGFRLGLGFVHFLYDRWLYKFSDPLVRAAFAFP